METFSWKYSTFSQQMATALLQRAFTNIANQQGNLGVNATGHGTCALIFYVTHAMIGRNVTNDSFEKKNGPCFNLIGSKATFFPVFSL